MENDDVENDDMENDDMENDDIENYVNANSHKCKFHAQTAYARSCNE